MNLFVNSDITVLETLIYLVPQFMVTEVDRYSLYSNLLNSPLTYQPACMATFAGNMSRENNAKTEATVNCFTATIKTGVPMLRSLFSSLMNALSGRVNTMSGNLIFCRNSLSGAASEICILGVVFYFIF